MTKLECRRSPSGFVIPSAFAIRASSFSGNVAVTIGRLTLSEVAVRFSMKTLIVSATIGALTLGAAWANRPVVEEKTQADNADYEYVTVTGSHLKQKMRKRNIITDTRTGNMITIDQREMQRNGMGDLSNQLNHYPGISISHH
jgi:hypothetical protein